MRSIQYANYGPADVLQIVETPIPVPATDEVLVKVKAISINPKDILIRSGGLKFLTGKKFPQTTGFDFAGELVLPSVASSAVQPVFGYIDNLKGGAAAEYVAVKSKWLTTIPTSLKIEYAAALPCTYLTALQALRDKLKVKSGERILIYGASGGVGTAAIQLSKYFGLHVTTVSSQKNTDYCLQNGADIALSYDGKNQMAGFTQPIDAFFQVYAKEGNGYRQACTILNKHGRFIGLIPDFTAGLKNILYRFQNKPRYMSMIAKCSKEDLALLADLAIAQKIQPNIEQQFELEEIVSAHDRVASGHVRGKIIVKISE